MNKNDLYYHICSLRAELEAAMRKILPGEASENDSILSMSRRLDRMISEYIRISEEP